MNERPPVSKLRQIYVAASTLSFHSYRQHVRKILLTIFSDDAADMSASLIPDAEDAVKLLGHGYAELKPMARSAYYQIARRPIQNYAYPWGDDISFLDFDQSELLSLLRI